jgi:hypothetical protein
VAPPRGPDGVPGEKRIFFERIQDMDKTQDEVILEEAISQNNRSYPRMLGKLFYHYYYQSSWLG